VNYLVSAPLSTSKILRNHSIKQSWYDKHK